MKDVVIAGAARTTMGGFQGDFDGVEASWLGGTAIRAATAAIVCANRASGDVITSEGLHHLEDSGGKAVLIAITVVFDLVEEVS